MSNKDLLVKKYPFLGYSTNLIEYFAIVGYKEKQVPNMLNNYRNEQKTIPPTILFSVTSNSDFGFELSDNLFNKGFSLLYQCIPKFI